MVKVTPIVPKSTLSAARLKRAIQTAYGQVAAAALLDFRSATRSWEHKPEFRIETDSDGIPTVSTDDEVFKFVDEGTDPHPIAAHKQFLRFQAGFRAKTAPDSVVSSTGGSFGPFVFKRVVQHPGTKARNFSKTIKARMDRQLPVLVDQAIRKATR